MFISISPRISLVDVTTETLPLLIELHKLVFPVSYGAKFFQFVLNSGDLAKLVYYDNQCAGAICCRLEKTRPDDYSARMYMMTLGVLKHYRNLGLGSILIEYIMSVASRITYPLVTSVYLHVQVANEMAIRFYLRNGFQIEAIAHDYYKLNENRDAYVLSRPVIRYK
ncbi:hypothetical protein CU097_008760 [Rhizopus azygosporus]|uniref:N-acetyltransferase domain-containing protein n=1 Tax=Rhizopus azygosporus TaxID=86630 RepID=A0A367JQP4_RHIAZ|nr:hypothetical protein CU097_008760 [Rhizopus azygosporus]